LPFFADEGKERMAIKIETFKNSLVSSQELPASGYEEIGSPDISQVDVPESDLYLNPLLYTSILLNDEAQFETAKVSKLVLNFFDNISLNFPKELKLIILEYSEFPSKLQLITLEYNEAVKIPILDSKAIRKRYYDQVEKIYKKSGKLRHINAYRTSHSVCRIILGVSASWVRHCTATANKVRKIARWKGFSEEEIGNKKSLDIRHLVIKIIEDDLRIVFQACYREMNDAERAKNKELYEYTTATTSELSDKAKKIHIWFEDNINKVFLRGIEKLIFMKDERVRALPKELNRKRLPKLKVIHAPVRVCKSIYARLFNNFRSLRFVEFNFTEYFG
jgi:hypothetical protein